MESEQIDALLSIVELSDEFIAEVIQACGNDPLVATSVILSRLVKVNDEVGTGHVFRKLMTEVVERTMEPQHNVH